MLPPNSRSLTKYRRRELSLKCGGPTRHAATSEATHRSPSCCLKVVQVRPVFQHPAVPTFYGLIESFQEHQAACPTFSLFFFFFLANITETDISTPQLSSPHTRLYKQSGQSYPLMFINWLCSLDLRVTPLWVKMPL